MIGQKNISFEKDTKQINDEVKKQIASHLWMFCGYSDSIYPAINIDAKYIKAISDLYNVIIDSSLITRLYSSIAPKNWSYLKDIDEIRETINMLRTVGGHTISLENVRQDVILKFRSWQINNCGTDNPMKDQEFEKLINSLLELEEDCLNIVKHFMHDASRLNGVAKDKLISDWEEAIINYYFKTANSNMFENKLIEWYGISQSNESASVTTNKLGLWNAVSNWIMNKIYLKEQESLNLLREIRKKYYPMLKADQKELLDQKIQTKEERIRSVQEEVAKFADKKIEKLTPVDYKRHYLSKDVLGKKMQEAIPEIKKQGLTLLPQDLFGYIVKRDLEKES